MKRKISVVLSEFSTATEKMKKKKKTKKKSKNFLEFLFSP